MDELGRLLDDLNLNDLTGGMNQFPTTMLPTSPQDIFNMVKFQPTMQMKVMACIVLILFVSLSLLRSTSTIARSIGMVFLFISLGIIILFILNL